MSVDFLKKIAAEKKDILSAKAAYYDTLRKNMVPRGLERYGVFKKAISKPGRINLIAEVKKASPSAGVIREDFQAERIAKIYTDHGAAAISVLTEETYFLGKMSYLKKISDGGNLPTLMKDFIVHEYQVYEGAFNGASAVLLIVAMLDDHQIKDLLAAAHALGLDCLVEVHEEKEIDRALKSGAEIIGINNRDLHSLKVDIGNALRMIPRIPKDKVIVAESGLKTREDVLNMQQAGAHAVLIGETFMRADNIGATIKGIMP